MDIARAPGWEANERKPSERGKLQKTLNAEAKGEEVALGRGVVHHGVESGTDG